MTKQFTILVLSALVLTASATATAHETESKDIVTACERLVHSYPKFRDSLDIDAYGKLFAEDATFSFGGKTTKGRLSIMNEIRERGPKQMNRHLTGSVVIEPLSETKARGTSYALVFQADPDEASPKALSPSSLLGFVTYHDEFSYQQETCVFQQRTVVIDFINKS